MRKLIRSLLWLFWLVFMVFSCPFIGLMDSYFGPRAVAEAEATPYLAFSDGDISAESPDLILPAAQLDTDAITADIYRSDMHYRVLSENEQIVYRALEYAMEHGYTSIMVDDQLITDPDILSHILSYLSLDSPLLEQNLRYTKGTFTLSHRVEVLRFFHRKATLTGCYITVDNFEACWWEKKQVALGQAHRIVDELPEGLSDMEKAEGLYRRLAQTVRYEKYPDEPKRQVHPYLYDAFVTGATHCDGYTNAMALLLRLCGIENAEKLSAAGDDTVGHTWNCMEIDGKWYNLDAVTDDYIPNDKSPMHAGFLFAFSDEMVRHETDNAHIFPACEEGYYVPVDARLPHCDTWELSDAIVDGFAAHDDLWALVVVEEFDRPDAKRQIQYAANRLHDTLHWFTYDLAGERTAIMVHDGTLLD